MFTRLVCYMECERVRTLVVELLFSGHTLHVYIIHLPYSTSIRKRNISAS
jgi:hypothetical protein